MPKDAQHERLAAIIENLPGAVIDYPWGDLHCKVAGKIFVGWGRRDDGVMSVGFKMDKEQQAAMVRSDPRFTVAAYVGKHGWVNMRLGAKPDWAEVEALIVTSYRMIAPRKLVKELDGRGATPPAPSARAKASPGRRR